MPARWSIYTWNTQGDFTATAKLAVVNNWFPARAVACLQEGGVGKAGDGGNWVSYGGTSVGAFNERCTNYVLLDKTQARFVTVEHLYLADKDGSVVVGGGIAGRTPAAVGVGSMLYVSWHSLSGKSNEDTAMLVAAVDGNPLYTKQYSTVVIGGDFNAAPADILGVISRGTERTKSAWNYPNRTVVNCGQNTHPGSNAELDFFIVLSKTAWTGLAASLLATAPSDHHAVGMTLWI